jgi:hypothetical protein
VQNSKQVQVFSWQEQVDIWSPDAFQENSKLLKLICVDCSSFCQHPNAVHV